MSRRLAIATVLALSGCAVGPDYRRPETAAPAAFREGAPWKEAAPKETAPKAGWWNVFGDPALAGLEERATSANPSAQAALARVDEARAAARIDRADFLPSLAVNAQGQRERFSGHRQVPPGAGHAGYATTSIDLPLDLKYELDLFGRVRRGYEAAAALAEARAADYQNVLLGLQAEVASDYFTLRALVAEKILLDRALDLRRQALDLVRKRRAGGANGDLEVYQAETELATAESDALTVDRRMAELRHALAALTGALPEDVSPETPALEAEPPDVPTGLPSDLLERRPDVASAERTLAAANAGIGLAKAAFFPAIGLTGDAGFNSTSLDSLLHWSSREWALGPYVSLPVFQGGRNRAGYERAQAAYQEASADYRESVLAAFRDVEDGLSDLRYLAAQSEALERASHSARKAADLSGIRYREGAADYFEVIDAERTALDVSRQAVELRGQRFAATVLLVKALGGGW